MSKSESGPDPHDLIRDPETLHQLRKLSHKDLGIEIMCSEARLAHGQPARILSPPGPCRPFQAFWLDRPITNWRARVLFSENDHSLVRKDVQGFVFVMTGMRFVEKPGKWRVDGAGYQCQFPAKFTLALCPCRCPGQLSRTFRVILALGGLFLIMIHSLVWT